MGTRREGGRHQGGVISVHAFETQDAAVPLWPLRSRASQASIAAVRAMAQNAPAAAIGRMRCGAADLL
jgi:hypothetical protein